MVSGRDHGNACISVSKSKHSELRACHALLDNDRGAGISELLIFHHVLYCLLCLIKVLGNDNALT